MSRICRCQWMFWSLAGFILWGASSPGQDPPVGLDRQLYEEHVRYLASDELGGRDSGEPGLEVAAEYLANCFRRYGLEPAGDEGTYFQTFTVPGGAELSGASALEIQGEASTGTSRKLLPRTEVVALGHGETAAVQAPLVFAGYGVTASEEDRKAGLVYDDYEGIDVRGKVVVILRFVPQWRQEKGAFGGRRSPHAALLAKLRNARDRGAAGAIVVTPPASREVAPAETTGENDIYGIAHRASPRHATLPAVLVHPAVALEICAQAGIDLVAVAAAIDGDLKPRSAPLPGLSARFETRPRQRLLRNVAARLPGASAELAREVILVGAHYDHIGRFGDQVAPRNLGQIHNGADDNASGTAGVLELARCLSRERAALERSVLFLLFSGEEIGLLGSRAWVQARRRFRLVADAPLTDASGEKELDKVSAGSIVEILGGRDGSRVEVSRPWSALQGWLPLAALEQISGPDPLHRLIAMVNLDMIGRCKEDGGINVVGSRSCQAFQPLLEMARARSGVSLRLSEQGLGGGGSDHATFLARQVPSLFFFSGMHADYNTPGDDPPTLNYPAALAALGAVREVVLGLGSLRDGLAFVAPPAPAHHGQTARPRLGVRLDLESSEPGARIEEVLPDSIAAKAGLQAGDIVLEIGGQRVGRAAELPEVIQDLPEGESVAIRYRRGDMEATGNVVFPVRRTGFGVTFGSVPDYGFAEKGVRFEGIRDGSPAAKAGVRAGDVLLVWGGKVVETVEDWTALLGRHKPGDEVVIKLRRGNEELELKVKLEARE